MGRAAPGGPGGGRLGRSTPPAPDHDHRRRCPRPPAGIDPGRRPGWCAEPDPVAGRGLPGRRPLDLLRRRERGVPAYDHCPEAPGRCEQRTDRERRDGGVCRLLPERRPRSSAIGADRDRRRRGLIRGFSAAPSVHTWDRGAATPDRRAPVGAAGHSRRHASPRRPAVAPGPRRGTCGNVRVLGHLRRVVHRVRRSRGWPSRRLSLGSSRPSAALARSPEPPSPGVSGDASASDRRWSSG